MYSCSYGIGNVVLLIRFESSIVLCIGPYSCLLLRMCIGIPIVLSWIFRKWDVGVWTGLSWLRIETVGGHL
jgi:hypothetical protein